jgi:hypothetical protein
MRRIFGLILFFGGFWFIGQNIVFSSRISFFSWQGLAAGGSVALMVCGIVGFFFGSTSLRLASVAAIAASIIIIFLSGTVFIQPTSLAEVFLGLGAMGAGAALINNMNINL